MIFIARFMKVTDSQVITVGHTHTDMLSL